MGQLTTCGHTVEGCYQLVYFPVAIRYCRVLGCQMWSIEVVWPGDASLWGRGLENFREAIEQVEQDLPSGWGGAQFFFNLGGHAAEVTQEEEGL